MMLRALWQRRTLLRGFIRREIGSRYAGTLGGLLWPLLQPVLMLAIYAFVFRLVFRVRLPELESVSYVSLVACALWPWMAFQEAVQRGTLAVSANAELVRKVAFPRQLLVLAVVAGSFIIHGGGFVIVLAALALWGEPLHWSLLPWVALGWVLLAVLAFALALITSGLQVVLQDVDHLLTPLFMLAFYASPVLYPLSMVPPAFAPWMALNPFAHALEPLRAALLYGELQWQSLAWVAGLAAIGLWCGQWVFRRLARRFEDFL